MRAIALIIAVASAGASFVQAAERPNILWLSCEDISPTIGCYGDPLATTPHIDAFATESVVYENAFTTAGVCAPCRSAIITGLYQTTLGTQHMRCSAALPETIKPFPTYLRNAGYYCTNNSKQDYQFKTPKGVWDESSGKAHWKNRKDTEQPFFAVFNYTGCHESGIASDSKYKKVTEGLKKHDRDEIAQTLPPYYPNTPRVREDWARNYDVITAMDRWFGDHVQQLEDAGLADETIVIFWSDHGVGLPRAKRWLYDSGTHVPLIVHIPEKFRVGAQGKPGTRDDRLVGMIDLAPTMLNLAGIAAPDYFQGQAFLGKNLPAPRDYIYGARDRMDERYDIIRMVRDQRFQYIRNYEPWKPYYQYMNTPEKGALMREIRRIETSGDVPETVALFTADSKPREELYDTKADPHGVNNLAGDPQYADVLKRMRQAHLAWVTETRDLGLIPEGELTRLEQQYGNRYDILRDPSMQEFRQQLATTANLAAGERAEVSVLLNQLQSPYPAVKYWALIGLGRHASGQPKTMNAIEQSLGAESNIVRCAAAWAAYQIQSRTEAETIPNAKLAQVLAGVLKNGTQWERLLAVNFLDEMDEDAKSVLDEMEAAREPRKDLVANGKYTIRVVNRALNEVQGTNVVVP